MLSFFNSSRGFEGFEFDDSRNFETQEILFKNGFKKRKPCGFSLKNLQGFELENSTKKYYTPVVFLDFFKNKILKILSKNSQDFERFKKYLKK